MVITLNDLNPANPALPLKFVGGRSIAVAGEVTNLSVERLADRPRYGRVECDVVIPVEITYTDNNGEEGVGYGTVTIHEDVILLLPEASRWRPPRAWLFPTAYLKAVSKEITCST